MKVYIQIKSAGNRSAARRAENPFTPKTPDRLARVPYELPDSVSTLRELIAALVRIEVGRYNEKGADRQLIPFLTGEEIREQAETGRVGFGRIWSEKKAEEAEAVRNACQCAEDGLVRIFQNDTEIAGLDSPVRLREGDCLTFIRLTFLSGRLW